ncbi:polycystin-1-like protein 1 isoform X2 [Lepidochelys kempii]|uniref:polycystin-1-like protein 1 isoform X2 n=1 Tax=Lepidochelys kempii TaxID=8472 RepID=UPI003C6FED65
MKMLSIWCFCPQITKISQQSCMCVPTSFQCSLRTVNLNTAQLFKLLKTIIHWTWRQRERCRLEGVKPTEFTEKLLDRKKHWGNSSTVCPLFPPPASNLFAMVSLLAEIPPSGGIILSSFIESISINQDSSLLDYCIMASGLVFLGLILINLYFQLFRMIQKSFLEYWQEPWNWLELKGVLITFAQDAKKSFQN